MAADEILNARSRMERAPHRVQEPLMKFSKAEIDAVIAASPRTTVPLNKLVLSEERQVRPQGSTPKLSIAELAASIKDSGVLQNLIVVKGVRGYTRSAPAGAGSKR
jgi:hypothetical protein